jgi:tetratricopeptide (TPR) repeat protein
MRRAEPRATHWQRRRATLVAPVVAVGALLAVGTSAAGNAAAQTDTQCTTAHAAELVPPLSLVTAEDYLVLGDYDYERGDCSQAIEDYSQAIALDPILAAAYNNRAYTAMRRQEYQAALVDLDRAVSLRPGYVAALMNRGDIHNYYYAVDRQLAMADYDRVIAAGGRPETSVCGHRLLASHGGWNLGVIFDLLTQGVDAGCPSVQKT